MSLKAQHARVQLAEQALQARVSETLSQTQQLAACWRANLSPGRVIVAGLALGFLVGRARPLQWTGSAGVLTMLRSVTQLSLIHIYVYKRQGRWSCRRRAARRRRRDAARA